MKKQVSISWFMASIIRQLEANRHWSTAHVYAATLSAIKVFAKGKEVYFGMLTPAWLKEFETHLRNKQCKWNTVSTYMRMLRAIYNRAVAAKQARFIPGLFDDVYTGVTWEHKQALDARLMHQLVYAEPCQPLTPTVEESREWLWIMFQLQGMPFIDLAHLHHSDYDPQKHLLTCHRQKTGTPLVISLTPAMIKWIEQHRNHDPEASPYLFPILSGQKTGFAEYREYEQVLKRFNRYVKVLAQVQGVNGVITSYTARHTWATLAKQCHIPEGLISDALGHTSIKTTQIYLKRFDNSSLKRANSKVIAYVKGAVTL